MFAVMNHYVTLALTSRKSSDHLHALYSPRTALRMFTPRRDHLMVCLLYMEFVPKGEPEGCEWVGSDRGGLHPLQMGAGVRSLLQKDTVFVLGCRAVLWGVATKPLNVCIAW
jgi:hypothetical protein